MNNNSTKETTQPESPIDDEVRFDPQVRILLCGSHGGFGFGKDFEAFFKSQSGTDPYSLSRTDPVRIQAISNYGRSLCDSFPFILDDMRAVHAWKLDKLFRSIAGKVKEETEFNPDLVAEAIIQQTYNQRSLESRLVCYIVNDFGISKFQEALRFAHFLLRGANAARYRVEPDEARDATIYERVGLWGASNVFCELRICDIPALVDYSIDEYDGQETVNYGQSLDRWVATKD